MSPKYVSFSILECLLITSIIIKNHLKAGNFDSNSAIKTRVSWLCCKALIKLRSRSSQFSAQILTFCFQAFCPPYFLAPLSPQSQGLVGYQIFYPSSSVKSNYFLCRHPLTFPFSVATDLILILRRGK